MAYSARRTGKRERFTSWLGNLKDRFLHRRHFLGSTRYDRGAYDARKHRRLPSSSMTQSPPRQGQNTLHHQIKREKPVPPAFETSPVAACTDALIPAVEPEYARTNVNGPPSSQHPRSVRLPRRSAGTSTARRVNTPESRTSRRHSSIDAFSNAPMSPSTVTEVSTQLGALLQHIPHAMSGLSAMAAHGFTGRQPTHVSLLCPSSSSDVIISWALASGMASHTTENSSFGITLLDGTTRKVQIHYLPDDAYDAIVSFTTRCGPNGICLLALPALLESYIRMYMNQKTTGLAMQVIAGDIRWLAERMSIRHDSNGLPPYLTQITPQGVPSLYYGDFWDLFSHTHYWAAVIFRQAGFRCSPKIPVESLFQPGTVDDYVGSPVRHDSLYHDRILQPPVGHDDHSEPSASFRRSRCSSATYSCTGNTDSPSQSYGYSDACSVNSTTNLLQGSGQGDVTPADEREFIRQHARLLAESAQQQRESTHHDSRRLRPGNRDAVYFRHI